MIPLLRNAFVQIKIVIDNEEIMTGYGISLILIHLCFIWKQHQIVPGTLSA